LKLRHYKASIFITAENKENFIANTIESCLNQTYKNIELIVAYTKLKNENFLKKKYNRKNVVFLKIKRKIQNKTQDQLFKLKKCLNFSTGDFIFLLDGDDSIKKNKVKYILNKYKYSSSLILDNYYHFNNSLLVKNKIHKFKNNIIYKKIVNSWPKRVATSSISINRELLINFFNQINFFNYKYLAIDILLTIYCQSKNKFIYSDKFLTIKKLDKNSVDLKFQGYKNKFFWFRRFEQHRYFKSLNKQTYLNIDYIFTNIINGLFTFYFKIFSNFK
tara:strand:+ start:54 stop:878 length:825 start_codon:yes stop_codon:yes gene_type:complete